MIPFWWFRRETLMRGPLIVFIDGTKRYLKGLPASRKVVRFLRSRPTQLPPRERVLAKMPRESVCAEIGVHEGDLL